MVSLSIMVVHKHQRLTEGQVYDDGYVRCISFRGAKIGLNADGPKHFSKEDCCYCLT
jgi:hypothetical protein